MQSQLYKSDLKKRLPTFLKKQCIVGKIKCIVKCKTKSGQIFKIKLPVVHSDIQPNSDHLFKKIRILLKKLIYPFTRRLNSSMLRVSGRPLSSSVFRRWKKLSTGALSRQLAFRDILWIK